MLTLTDVTWLDILLCLACAGVYFLMWVFNKKNPAPYPPGPPGWPHLRHASHPSQALAHLRYVGREVWLLSTMNVLLFPIGDEVVGWKHSLALLPDGDRFRWSRRNLHRVIGSRAAAHIRHTTGAIILRISYGYEMKKNDDPFVDLADRDSERLVRESRETLEEMVFTPYDFVKDQMAAGIAPESFTSNLLENRTSSLEDDNVVKWSAASLYAGGADTTVSVIYSFFLAMTLFHDVQKKAQAEIDAVIGPDRLPSFADRGSLPYTEALAKEVLRWNVVAPTGLPHRVTEDDVHDGYFIPKCSLVIPNIWLNACHDRFMLNNPQTYPSPLQFNPERFLSNDEKKAETDHRSICPGIHLAEAAIRTSRIGTSSPQCGNGSRSSVECTRPSLLTITSIGHAFSPVICNRQTAAGECSDCSTRRCSVALNLRNRRERHHAIRWTENSYCLGTRVDMHTAQHVVQHCLFGELARDRTIILVTSLCLPIAYYVAELSRGSIARAGDKEAFQDIGDLDVLNEVVDEETEVATSGIQTSDDKMAKDALPKQWPSRSVRKLVEAEVRAEGRVPFRTYCIYIKAVGLVSRASTVVLMLMIRMINIGNQGDDNGIITPGQDADHLSQNQSHWQWAKLLDAGKEESISFTYNRDRLAVAFPRFGVRFVEDGQALLGGTSDGVLRHLDVSPNETQALVSQVGARAHLVGIQGMDRKGKIEQVHAMNGDSTSDAKQSTPAVFGNGGRSVVFHSRESFCLVWNKMKDEVWILEIMSKPRPSQALTMHLIHTSSREPRKPFCRGGTPLSISDFSALAHQGHCLRVKQPY
ncbi:cytochrome P450 [Suillus variegatus]|nr:cytochrome P450 [Suillus variegatus]